MLQYSLLPDDLSRPAAGEKPVILTGDRPTGPLHLGHWIGSLRNRVALQHTHRQFVLIADTQALTDNGDDPGKISRNVLEITIDQLAAGLDPTLTTFCLQSALPALAELTLLYMNLVTVARLERNPTIKDEIQARGFGRDIPAGFLCYPVAQAADITGFRATVVPVGEDQIPMIEQTVEVVRRINRLAGAIVLPEPKALVPTVGRLPGLDGRAKMSKSQGNALALGASPDEIRAAVRRMYTDPDHLRVEDPGKIEGNVVFAWLAAFDEDRDGLRELEARYRHGGLGDATVKRRLEDILQAVLAPIRERRARFAADPGEVAAILARVSETAREITQATLDDVRAAFGLYRLPTVARTIGRP
ncbi:MAG: tryptophan--tRNA ligase [Phyllobacteriaceae bacterium]|nr:tryptophan--tRNA ligase [Phyllobacteriaceae bacterium]